MANYTLNVAANAATFLKDNLEQNIADEFPKIRKLDFSMEFLHYI